VLGSDPGHQLIALVELLPLVESESVGKGLSEVIGGRLGELWFVGHGQMVATEEERIKNSGLEKMSLRIRRRRCASVLNRLE
jgi:hypothetical protein